MHMDDHESDTEVCEEKEKTPWEATHDFVRQHKGAVIGTVLIAGTAAYFILNSGKLPALPKLSTGKPVAIPSKAAASNAVNTLMGSSEPLIEKAAGTATRYGNPHVTDVGATIRNLPAGWHHSVENGELAKEAGVFLEEGQSYIKHHTRAYGMVA